MRRLTWPCAIERPRAVSLPEDTRRVEAILADVRAQGDAAVFRYSELLESGKLESLRVPTATIRDATSRLTIAQMNALVRAKCNIERFHSKQGFRSYATVVEEGLLVERVCRPLLRVGIYVPAGSAPLPSSLLMAAVPARLAGCKDVVVCTPRGADGEVAAATLVAASLCGIDEIYQIGGAQAIAAMAYGTGSIRKVDKIAGPGNRWVTLAKTLVAQDERGAAIDMPAGPSEVMVVADSTARAAFVASDLLSQAEHGADSHVVLVTLDDAKRDDVEAAVRSQLARLGRAAIATSAMEHAVSVRCKSKAEAIAAIDAYAPEHLILQVASPEDWLPEIRRAGSVFCGPWTPETAGDYASGSNHVLPTGGWAKSFSGLGVESFQRTMTVQTLTPAALLSLAPTLTTLAELEGLDAHGAAVRVRIEALDNYVAPKAEADLPMRINPAALTPYVSASGVDVTKGARLNANELSDFHASDARWNRYPEPQPTALRAFLAELYGIGPSRLLLTRGADEAIDLVVKTFGGEGERVLLTPPTYGFYTTVAHSYGCTVVPIPLSSSDGFAPNMEGLVQTVAGTKIVFLCNPNNPTGRAWTRAELLQVLAAARGHAIVVIDEAYAEFYPSCSAIDLISQWPNLLVIRTLSKAWGMAGVRIGSLMGQESLLARVRLMAAPYPLSSPSVAAALANLGKETSATFAGRIDAIRSERQRVSSRLEALANVVEVVPSEANFLFVRVKDPEILMTGLAKAGIHIRDRSNDFPGAVRVTIGSPEENNALLDAWGGLA